MKKKRKKQSNIVTDQTSSLEMSVFLTIVEGDRVRLRALWITGLLQGRQQPIIQQYYFI